MGEKLAVNALIMDDRKAGIGNYAFQLFKAMENIPIDFQVDVHIQEHMEKYFTGKPNLRFISHRDFKSSRERIMYEQLRMPHIYNKEGYKLVHFVDYLSPLLPIKARRLFTFHDLAYFKLPQSFTLGSRLIKQFFTGWGVRRASGVICVSHNTRKDLLEKYPFLDKDIVNVIHLAGETSPGIEDKQSTGNKDEQTVNDDQNILKKYGIYSRFILAVGTLEPRKNYEVLVEAYKELVSRSDISHKLVICGKKGWKYDGILDKLNHPSLKERVIITGYVAQELLPVFYRQADLFVYPSLYEGFGLPPLEALSHGVPVITSNVASLPEVVGDAALTFKPDDVRELADLMLRVLKDDKLRNSLREKGPEQAKKFSWRTTAEKTIEIYRQLLKKEEAI